MNAYQKEFSQKELPEEPFDPDSEPPVENDELTEIKPLPA